MGSSDPERQRDGMAAVHLKPGDPQPAERRCPDDGRCWHECGQQPCFRVLFCAPLSAYGEVWTREDVLAEAAREEDAHDYRL